MNTHCPNQRSRVHRSPASAILLAAVSAVTSACGLPASPASGPATHALRITTLPEPDEARTSAKYRLIERALADELGVRVEFVPVENYTRSVAAFTAGDVQLAWLGGVDGVQARHAVPGSRAIACGRADPYFRAFVVAHASTGVSASSSFPVALRGKTFTFGRPDSTSGGVMPRHFFTEATGVSSASFFGEVRYDGGSHSAVARSVESGEWDAGVLNFQIYERLVDRGELDPTRCVKVWETPPFPNYSWSAHPSLDTAFGAGFIDRLQAVLVAIDDPLVLDGLGRPDGLIAASNGDYAFIEAVCREADLIVD